MEILFHEILPPDVLLYAGIPNSSHFSIFGAFWTKMHFSNFDLENDCHGHIFSRSKYQKRVVGENFELSHVKIGHMV
jgi:hypothetical protein